MSWLIVRLLITSICLLSFSHLESEEEVEEEPEERQPSPEPLQESPNSTTYYEPHPVTYAQI